MTNVIVRIGKAQWASLWEMLSQRYPDKEWATWLRFGWRIQKDHLILTLNALDAPREKELDSSVAHVAFQETYSLRMALESEAHPFAIGVAHSHPLECLPIASRVDDDMDAYYADYLSGFTRGRPYVSLIFSQANGEFQASGRVWFNKQWLTVIRFIVDGFSIPTWIGDKPAHMKAVRQARVERLTSSFGAKSAAKIRNACVAVVGAGGTGSPAIEVLARAGVGHLIVVDPDHIEESNLERVHGSLPKHVDNKSAKVQIAKDHVFEIDPEITFEGLIGSIPQEEVVNALARSDVIIGCTDQQHSRLAMSEIAFRYVIPFIDCGVSLEGAGGQITGQTIQLVHFATGSPCVVCRKMIDWQRVSQELMSKEERELRKMAAQAAAARGENGNGYWREASQLNTVGYLTTAAGSLAAGCAIGIISGAFRPSFSRQQINPFTDPVHLIDWVQDHDEGCTCKRNFGVADLYPESRLISPPAHWPAVEVVT